MLGKYYAIKHTPTKKFLPNWGSRRGLGGFTHDQPTDPRNAPPRLFGTRRAAGCALSWYLKGRTVCYSSIDYCDEWKTDPVPSRLREEFEIVKILLTEE